MESMDLLLWDQASYAGAGSPHLTGCCEGFMPEVGDGSGRQAVLSAVSTGRGNRMWAPVPMVPV